MRFHPVADADQLVEGQAIAVEIEGRPVALVRSGERIFALGFCDPEDSLRPMTMIGRQPSIGSLIGSPRR